MSCSFQRCSLKQMIVQYERFWFKRQQISFDLNFYASAPGKFPMCISNPFVLITLFAAVNTGCFPAYLRAPRRRLGVQWMPRKVYISASFFVFGFNLCKQSSGRRSRRKLRDFRSRSTSMSILQREDGNTPSVPNNCEIANIFTSNSCQTRIVQQTFIKTKHFANNQTCRFSSFILKPYVGSRFSRRALYKANPDEF